MKLSTVVLSSTVVLFGVAACAAPSGEEEVAESSQALCPKGMNCTPPKKTWFGGIDPGQLATVDMTGTGSTPDPNTYHCGVASGETFTCAGPPVSCDDTIIAKTTTQTGCDMHIRCETTAAGVQICDCVPGCGGGGWGFGSFNPCVAGLTYTCNSLGQCRCS